MNTTLFKNIPAAARIAMAVLGLGLNAWGCATAIHGSTERIAVTSSPSGAEVSVDPGGAALTTPGSVELPRDRFYMLTYKLDGYRSRSVEVAPEYSWAHAGNLLAGGLLGSEIDQQTGAAFRLTPNPAHANLLPSGSASPFPWNVAVASPTDLRASSQRSVLQKAAQTCDTASPFGAKTALAVQHGLRGELLNSGLFEGVANGEEAGNTEVVRAEILAMCSRITGFLVLRVVGIASIRLTLVRNGAEVFEKSYYAAVSDQDEAYTGAPVTTREQARLRTVLDSLNVVTKQFVSDLNAMNQTNSDQPPEN